MDFCEFELLSTQLVNHNVHRYEFQCKVPFNPFVPFPVASCVQIRLPDNPDLVRPYTPMDYKTDENILVFTIKDYNTNGLADHLKALKASDRILIKGPLSKYPYKANQWDHIGMLAGGAGITPMIQVLRRIFEDKDDHTKVTLVYGCRNVGEIMVRSELDQWAADHPDQFKLHYTLSRPETTDEWKGEVGRIDKARIQKYMPAPSDKNFKILICGNDSFHLSLSGRKAPDKSQGELTGALAELGYTAEQVFKY